MKADIYISKMKFKMSLLLLGMFTSFVAAQEIKVHDPVVGFEDGTYYLFCTGKGISCFSSTDLKDWKREPSVFQEKPKWTDHVVAEFNNHIWAPDISFYNGTYYLYYSVSAFAKNTSAIGVATNNTLDRNNKGFNWVDHGIVIQSVPNRDLWNAIDPNLIFDEQGTPWLSFGSFWNGLKMVKLNDDLKTIAQPEEWHTIARRKRTFELEDTDPGDGALEAPFLFKKNNFYYLFLSWDYCCRGEKSNYKIVVGRSDNATGPFLDKTGKNLNNGGGTLLVEGNKDWYGAGHCSAYNFNGKDYLFYHAYDANDKASPKLRISEINWDDQQWPEIENMNKTTE